VTDLDELSRLLEQATPGPWKQEEWTNHITSGTGANWLLVATMATNTYRDQGRHNADLVAALRNHAEELVRDARRFAYLESFFSPMGLDANGNHPWMCRSNPARLRGPNLRAAIDAAIAQEQP
jgi:hypothetical protein